MGVLTHTRDYDTKRAKTGGMEYGVAVTDFLQVDPTYTDGTLMETPCPSTWNPLPLMNEDPTRRHQNVRICYDDELCEPDCIVFVTTQDVPVGTELLTFYGAKYDRSAYT